MKSMIDRYFSVHADDELVIQRGQHLIVLLLLVSVADLLVIVNDIVSGIATPGVRPVLLLGLVIFGALYWYTRRGHRWPPAHD
ncbi:MAG: hypothetical protein P8186_32115 [Anaerolineae bacterium]